MPQKKDSEHFQVYILASKSIKEFVKVGRTNNHGRIPALIRMWYAGINDWEHFKSFEVESNHAAIAIESMAHAKLINQNRETGRLSWINQINKKISFADECFKCSAEHAAEVVSDMRNIYKTHVA